MSQELPSTEAELTTIVGDEATRGVSWNSFGTCTQGEVDLWKEVWAPLTLDLFPRTKLRTSIQNIWTRYPRNQGEFFILLHCLNVSVCMSVYLYVCLSDCCIVGGQDATAITQLEITLKAEIRAIR